MTLRGGSFSAMEKGRGQEARQRCPTPNHSEPVREVRTMADISQYNDSAYVRNENATRTLGAA